MFIAAGVTGQIFWNTFSFMAITGEASDGLPRGIIIAFFKVLFNRDLTFPAGHILEGDAIRVGNLWIREASAPGLLGLVMTILTFFIVIWVESVRIEIPLTYAGYKGYRGKYPMKLLYVSNIPVILAQALYANVLFFGQLLWNALKDNATWSQWIGYLGTFEERAGSENLGSHLQPTGGLIYYLTPPQGLSSMITALRDAETNAGGLILHSVIYLIFFILICVVFSRIWIEVSGLAPRAIARQIIHSKM